jgi:hypothetical protein
VWSQSNGINVWAHHFINNDAPVNFGYEEGCSCRFAPERYHYNEADYPRCE